MAIQPPSPAATSRSPTRYRSCRFESPSCCPLTAMPLAVGQQRSVKLIDDVMRGNRFLALVAQHEAKAEPANPEDLYSVGTVGMIHQMARVPDGTVRLMVQGLERIKIRDWIGREPYLVARIEASPDMTGEATETEALRHAVVDIFRRLVEVSPDLPDELAAAAENVSDPRHLAYFVASVVPFDVATRQAAARAGPGHRQAAPAGRSAAARAGRARAGPQDHHGDPGAPDQAAA